MTPLNIPLLMVGAFLVLTLVVGLASKRATTFREYAVDNKRLPTVKLVATLLATSFSGASLIMSVEVCYSFGLSRIIPILADFLPLWMTSLVWVRMAPFMEHLSIAKTIGNIYGKCPRVIVALLSICGCVTTITIEINVISLIISMCIGSVDLKIVTMLSTLVLIAYATLGGIRSVTNTDVLQFITFVAIIFLIAKLMFVKTGKSVLEIVSLLQKQEKLQLSSLCHSNGQPLDLRLFILWSIFSISDPAVVHRGLHVF